MATSQGLTRRLADLLRDPRETLDVEIKGWIDIVQNEDHRALLAKALIALANHGGGFAIIGFERSASGMAPAQGRPADLTGFTTDSVNAVVTRYAEPPFHCDVQVVGDPAYPIISVPGGHRFPIRSKRSGPNGQGIQANTYYIRRPGPRSEQPQSAQEWDELMRRCLGNGRDELVNSFRLLLAGGAPVAPPETDLDRVNRWFEASKGRWQELVNGLAKGHSARLPLGHYAVGYQVIADFEPVGVATLVDAMQRGVVRHTGWPPFWIPTRDETKPYVYDGNVECWLARDGKDRDPGHSDYWRASPQGQFFLMRGYQEDGIEEVKRLKPGAYFDITVPSWRMGEILLHAASMARVLNVPQAQIVLVAEWTGLAGRELADINGRRLLFDGHRTQQDTYRTNVVAQADQIADTLPEVVSRMVKPLYELFDFFQLPATLVPEELARMRKGQF